MGLDVRSLSAVLPSRVSMDAAGRAVWLAEVSGAVGGGVGESVGIEGSAAEVAAAGFVWEAAAQRELDTIPFFVRERIRGKTERYAADRGLGASISLVIFLEAKAFYGSGGVIAGLCVCVVFCV